MDKLLLRPAEAAEALGISRSRLYQMLAGGQLPVVRVGQSMRVPVRELERWIGERLSAAETATSMAGGSDGESAA
jgi:excisionase family DNA binding protein